MLDSLHGSQYTSPVPMADVTFWVCAGAGAGAGILVVTRRNPIYSAFFLIAVLLAVAASLVPLGAAFLAAMHVLVYTGAIMVLFVFVILLLNLRSEDLGPEYPVHFRIFAAVLSLAFFGIVASTAAAYEYGPEPPLPEAFGRIGSLGTLLFGPFVLPFEIVALMLIVAIIAGIVLAKRTGT